MPSAPNTPGASRREPVSSVSTLASISPQPTKRVPKSVASMVRRFELEAVSDTKTRAGFKSGGSRSRQDLDELDDDDDLDCVGDDSDKLETTEGAGLSPVSSLSSLSDTRGPRPDTDNLTE